MVFKKGIWILNFNLNFQFSVNKKKMTAIYLRKTPYVHCGDHHSAKALSKNKLQSVWNFSQRYWNKDTMEYWSLWELVLVCELEEEKKELAQDYASLRDKTFKIANELQITKDCCDNMEQYTRRDCLEVCGIPVQQGEDTNDIIIKLGSKIGK